MGLKRGDRVKDQTTTVGTGTITLGGAQTGYVSFGSVLSNGDRCLYVIQGTTEWEVGYGTYTSSGTTLSRDQIIVSSNSNNLVSFSSGTKTVFLGISGIEQGAYDASIYGAGVDGDVTISSGTTTLTRNMYYNTLTITGTTSAIAMGGYRIYVKDKLDISGYTGSGPIFTTTTNKNGASGGSGGYNAGGAGATGTASNPGNGGNGGNGGSGGTSTQYSGGSGGSGGTVTNETIGVLSDQLTGAKNNVLYGAGGASGAGGGAGAGYYANYGKSGTIGWFGTNGATGGASGGTIVILTRIFITGASNPAASFSVPGVAGSNGGAGNSYFDSIGGVTIYTGAGGGGGGGGGGWILFGYTLKIGSSVTNLFRANGGAGGTGGASAGGGTTAGAGGYGGNGGNIYLWDLKNNVINTTSGSAGSANSGTTGGSGGTCGASL